MNSLHQEQQSQNKLNNNAQETYQPTNELTN